MAHANGIFPFASVSYMQKHPIGKVLHLEDSHAAFRLTADVNILRGIVACGQMAAAQFCVAASRTARK